MAILDELLLQCQNSAALESAYDLLKALTSSPRFSGHLEQSGTLMNILEDMGFGGLWRMCSLNNSWEANTQCFALTEKLIEVSDTRIN